MRTVTLSLRLPKTEAGQLASAAAVSGMDRPAFLKCALRRGVRGMLLDQAAEGYRRHEITLSRAAEVAGLDLRDFIARMRGSGIELNYTTDDLEKDLRP